MGKSPKTQMALEVEHLPMSAIRSLKTAALSLAAAVVLTNGVATASPDKGPKDGKQGGGNSGPGMIKQPNLGGGVKIDPGFSQGPKNGGIKIDPGFGQGPKNGNGPKLDPGIGNGQGPKNGNGPKLDPGIGNGMGMKPSKPGDKPWMQKPTNGKPNTIFCKGPSDSQYCYKYGVKKSFGYCYKGYDHCHWYCNKWSSVHNCWFFFDPSCSLWYYWCEPDLCYYPCNYLPYRTYVYVAPAPVIVATPVLVATPAVTTTTTTTTASAVVGGTNVVAGGVAPAQPAAVNPAPINLPPLPGEK